MRLFKRAEESGAENAPSGEALSVLRDRALLAEWYMLHRLDEELERSRCDDRPLSVLVGAPMLLPGEQLSSAEIEVAAAAARAAVRSFARLSSTSGTAGRWNAG
jgi:hypothetical protein